MCLGGALGRDLEGLGPLAGCVTLAHSHSLSSPVVHVAVLALSSSGPAVHRQVLCVRERMPPHSLALFLLGIQPVPRGYHEGPLSSPLRVKCAQESHACPGAGLCVVWGWALCCVRMAGRSFDLLFDVEAGESG